MSNTLKVFAFNPNGIRGYLKKATNELRKFVKEYFPDVLFFIETKMNSDPKIVCQVNKDLQNIFQEETGCDYEIYWSNCERPGRHGTGVAIKKNDTLKIKEIRYNIDFLKSNTEHESEGRAITVYLSHSDQKNRIVHEYVLVGLYVVNASQQLKRLEYKKTWNEKLSKYLTQLVQENASATVFVLGDMNVAANACDIANPDSNTKRAGYTHQEREQFKQFLNSGWVDMWREKNPIDDIDKSQGKNGVYTFWNTKSKARSRNAGWRIDYTLCNTSSYSSLSDAITPYILTDVQGSDHCPVGFTLR